MPDAAPSVLVACLCAAWCTTCSAYRDTFAALAAQHPALRFAWIDIEDDSDTLGDDALEIENFPTVMLMREGRVLFFGTVLPHASTVARMVEAIEADALAPGGAAGVSAQMAAAVWRLAPQRPVPAA
jgi:thiol-disulfide isomerase/thioredoxin